MAYLATPLQHVGQRQVGYHDVRVSRRVGAELMHARACAGDDVLVGQHDALGIALNNSEAL